MKGKYRKARLQLARGFKFSLILALSAVLSVAGCFSMENTELTELRLDKAQTLYDQGQKEEAIRLILENPSVDPLIQGRRNWMLTEMLGLASSGVTGELTENNRVILQNDNTDRSWKILSVSPDRKTGLIDFSSRGKTDIRLIDLSNGNTLAEYNQALRAALEASDESRNELFFSGGCFINDEEILLWTGNSLCKFNSQKGTEILQKAELGTGPREYEKDEYGLTKLTIDVYYPAQPTVIDVKMDEKLFVLMDCGIATVDSGSLEVEEQVLSNDYNFTSFTSWDIKENRILVSCSDLDDKGIDERLSSGLFQIDLSESDPEIHVLSDQRVLGTLWGLDGDYYALEPVFPEQHNFTHSFIRLGRFDMQIVRYEDEEEKSRSRHLDLRREQLSVTPVMITEEDTSFLCTVSGDEVLYLNPQTLEVESRIETMSDVFRLWKGDDGSLAAEENLGILEFLSDHRKVPATLFTDDRFTEFIRSANGDWLGVWSDGFLSGISQLDLRQSAGSISVEAEKIIRGVDYCRDPETGKLWRLLYEEDHEKMLSEQTEKNILLEIGYADESSPLFSYEFHLTDQESDGFNYGSPPGINRPALFFQYSLGGDEKGIYIEYVSNNEIGRIYPEHPNLSSSQTLKEKVHAASIAPDGGMIAVSDEYKLKIYSYDPEKGTYSVISETEELAQSGSLSWNFDQSILIALQSRQLAFMNLENGELSYPEGLSDDGLDGNKAAPVSYDIEDSQIGKVSNLILIEVETEHHSGEHAFWIVDVETGKKIVELSGESLGFSNSGLHSVKQISFCEDDSRLLIVLKSGDLVLWSVDKQRPVYQNRIRTFQKTEPQSFTAEVTDKWAVLSYDGYVGYDIDSGTKREITALYRIEKDHVIPWMSFTGESYYVFPEEEKAIIHGRDDCAQIELPLQSDVEAAAREYLAEKEKSKIIQTGT